MNHPNREEWAPYLFGEAPIEDQRKLEEHLAACEECDAYVQTSRRTLARMERWQVPPRARAPMFRWTVLKLAAAAALVLGIGVGLGRLTASSKIALPLDATLHSPLKAALAAELHREWQAELHAATNAVSIALAASRMEMEDLAARFARALQMARAEDQRFLVTAVAELQQTHARDYFTLRKDFETMATMTEEEFRRARRSVIQLATSGTPSN